jgi:putative ABC transport system permease protein
VAIISQAVARQLWPGQDPIGKRLSMEDHPTESDWLTIVGVVGDVRQQSLAEKPSPAVYRPYRQVSLPFFLSHISFIVRTRGNPESLAGGMRQVLRSVDRDQPVESISSMRHEMAAATSQPEFRTRLLGVFSLLALILSAIGIYAVLAYSVAQRTREIGIRMALGAKGDAVIRLVLLRTLKLTGLGVMLGGMGALLATRALEKFLFDVKPSDPLTYSVVVLLLVLTAVVSALIPARRASKVDPLGALRHE